MKPPCDGVPTQYTPSCTLVLLSDSPHGVRIYSPVAKVNSPRSPERERRQLTHAHINRISSAPYTLGAPQDSQVYFRASGSTPYACSPHAKQNPKHSSCSIASITCCKVTFIAGPLQFVFNSMA